jgi:hypothetical protein
MFSWQRNGKDAILYAVALVSLIMAGLVVRARPGRPAVRPVARSVVLVGPAESRVVESTGPPVARCFDPATLQAIGRMGARKSVARAKP